MKKRKDYSKPWKCPACKTFTTGYPALSRRDNKTEVCSACGTKEAFDDFFNFRKGGEKS